MKKSILITVFTLFSLVTFNYCGNKNTSTKESKTETKEVTSVKYTCPMHSEVTSDKPGECPKCGMALVEKK